MIRQIDEKLSVQAEYELPSGATLQVLKCDPLDEPYLIKYLSNGLPWDQVKHIPQLLNTTSVPTAYKTKVLAERAAWHLVTKLIEIETNA